jgi:hypothetical protein
MLRKPDSGWCRLSTSLTLPRLRSVFDSVSRGGRKEGKQKPAGVPWSAMRFPALEVKTGDSVLDATAVAVRAGERYIDLQGFRTAGDAAASDGARGGSDGYHDVFPDVGICVVDMAPTTAPPRRGVLAPLPRVLSDSRRTCDEWVNCDTTLGAAGRFLIIPVNISFLASKILDSWDGAAAAAGGAGAGAASASASGAGAGAGAGVVSGAGASGRGGDSHGDRERQDLVLELHHARPCTAQVVQLKVHAFRSVLMARVLQLGKEEPLMREYPHLAGMKKFELSGDSGTMVVIVNEHPTAQVEVTLQWGGGRSNNILSTRPGGESRDVIRPLSRQIVLALTWDDPALPYSLGYRLGASVKDPAAVAGDDSFGHYPPVSSSIHVPEFCVV